MEAIALRLKRKTELATVKVEFERARKACRQCISSPQGCALVDEREGRVWGFVIGVSEHFWFSTERYFSDLCIFSTRIGGFERLLDAFLEWGRGKGATPILAQSSGRNQERVRALYEAKGLLLVGGVYMGEKPIVVPQLRSVR